MLWHKFKPRVGDLIVLEYHRGRRVGIFIRRNLKGINKKHPTLGIIWTIAWIPVENEKLPSSYLSELTIFNYLKSSKAVIYRRKDEV